MSLSEFATPRSALRDINEGSKPLRNLKPLKSTNPPANPFKKPSCPLQPSFGLHNIAKKKHFNIHVDADPKQTVKPIKATFKVKEPKPDPDICKPNEDEIELLHIFDSKLDFKPKRDPDFSGVAEKLRNWRPPCLFGQRPDSDLDDSDDDEMSLTMHRSFPILPPLDYTNPFQDENLEELYLFEVPVPDIDLPFPHVAEFIY